MSRLIDADAFWKPFEEGKAKLLLIKSMLPPEMIDATLKIYAEIKEMIDSMPTIEPEPRWIPCTPETMPKEDDVYLVYAPNYTGGSSSAKENHKGVMFSKYRNGKWSIEHGYHKRPNCVKAWMPLPEPYRKVEE